MTQSEALSPTSALDRLLAIMARLRDPATGCEWDVAQTFETIAPYTIEEAYEVADAIARGDLADLKDELGDLLLQVVFHARIAEEAGHFAFADVAAAISDKMERRHPHIFLKTSDHPEEPMSPSNRRLEGWEQVKAAERAARGQTSVLDGVTLSLPALKRAEKMQNRAAREGFDWPDATGPRAKLDEELAEIDAAGTPAELEAEIGDLLFSAVNLARHHGLDAEAALTDATRRFERRFRLIEQSAGKPLLDLSLENYETLWQAAKRQLASGD